MVCLHFEMYLYVIRFFLDEFKNMDQEVLRCRYRRDFCVLILRLIQSPDLSLLDFRKLLTSKKYTLPDTVIDSFDQTLSDMNEDGVGKLLDVVDSLDKILSNLDNTLNESKSSTTNSASTIAKTSVVGKLSVYVLFLKVSTRLGMLLF